MPKKLIRATVPMCPECGSELVDQENFWTCDPCGMDIEDYRDVGWGYYAPDIDDIAANLRRFAGDRDWEFEDGEPADLQGWADSIEAAPDIDGVGRHTGGGGWTVDYGLLKQIAYATESSMEDAEEVVLEMIKRGLAKWADIPKGTK